MARKKIPDSHSTDKPAGGWELLTWDDLRAWAGSRGVEKGRSYIGHVKQLQVTDDNQLLAWVNGTSQYATTARIENDGSLVSECSCPVQENGCKHGVAVVLAYLEVLKQKQSVPTASSDDPRWDKLRNSAEEFEDDPDTSEFSYEEFEDDDFEDGDDADQDSPKQRRSRQEPAETRSSMSKKAAAALRKFLNSKPPHELAEMLMDCAERDEDFRATLQDQQSLQGGQFTTLIKATRREINRVTSEQVWVDSWSDECSIPDYGPIQRRLQCLLDAGYADAVVELGKELLDKGLEQVAEAQDEGETGCELRDAMNIVFQAVINSSLSPHKQLMYAIDVLLQDDYDYFDDAMKILDHHKGTDDWSAVADELSQRLRKMPTQDSTDSYQREQLSGFLIFALEHAGRADEILAVCESEAIKNGNYLRLVRLLMEGKHWQDAERWAREGIANTSAILRGVIHELKEVLCSIAAHNKDWPRVAAFAADEFFESPTVETFEQLIKAAHNCGCDEQVEAVARHFLETGIRPDVGDASSERSKPQKGSTNRNKPPATSKRPTSTLTPSSSPAWPLPKLDLPKPKSDREYHWTIPESPHRHIHVLLDLALKAKQPDEILRLSDKLVGEFTHFNWHRSSLADRVASSVASAYPERSIEIWNKMIDAEIAGTSVSHYEEAAKYLRKVRVLLVTLNRETEWLARLAGLRETHRRKRRLIEILDGLQGPPIAST